MIKQECIGIPDMILLLMIFLFKKIKNKAEIVLSPEGAYFTILSLRYSADFGRSRLVEPCQKIFKSFTFEYNRLSLAYFEYPNNMEVRGVILE